MSGSGVPGGDLLVASGPGIPRGVVIAAVELVERFSKSSGPGGQGVNTTDSRVELLYDVEDSTSLTQTQRARVGQALGQLVVVVAAEHRSQYRNRVAARDRLAAQLRSALAPPGPRRRATKPTRGSQTRRLAAKRRRGDTKGLRGRVRGED
ncbi:MAG: alternative ribosome rescue aminoacyl-tRNA hydrolase ArfB [Micrococcales bacterium]|nr:alternative ribosome rescue aminoacyl-tRNA hydrolase ArfB [Micrococcales bacterium]